MGVYFGALPSIINKVILQDCTLFYKWLTLLPSTSTFFKFNFAILLKIIPKIAICIKSHIEFCINIYDLNVVKIQDISLFTLTISWPFPENIFGFCKRLIGKVWQKLKTTGTKNIYNRMFFKRFMYTVY